MIFRPFEPFGGLRGPYVSYGTSFEGKIFDYFTFIKIDTKYGFWNLKALFLGSKLSHFYLFLSLVFASR